MSGVGFRSILGKYGFVSAAALLLVAVAGWAGWARWSGRIPRSERPVTERFDPDSWTNDLRKARHWARQTGRPILADFTGSDWCYGCKLLQKKVFSTDKFKRWATEHFVLLKLDFPRNIEQPEWLKRQNRRLADRFKVSGFPTIVLFTSDFEELARTSYRPLDPAKWIEQVEQKLADRSDKAEGTSG